MPIILDISIAIFVFLELLNVCILYFAPSFNKGNGVAIFSEWEKSKQVETSHLFAKYMANWVAGTKLIFIALLAIIFFTGSEIVKVHSVVGLLITVPTYYFGLHPIITKLDKLGEIKPKGYSKTLGFMILGFLVMFVVALIAYYLTK